MYTTCHLPDSILENVGGGDSERLCPHTVSTYIVHKNGCVYVHVCA